MSYPSEMLDERTCRVAFRVRYAETDAFGYLHHARYLEYFEQARTELLRGQGVAYRALEESGVFFVVYKFAVRYLRPVRYDDVLHVTVRVDRVTPTRVEHRYEIHKSVELISEATSTLACVGRDGRPRCMPEFLWIPA